MDVIFQLQELKITDWRANPPSVIGERIGGPEAEFETESHGWGYLYESQAHKGSPGKQSPAEAGVIRGDFTSD